MDTIRNQLAYVIAKYKHLSRIILGVFLGFWLTCFMQIQEQSAYPMLWAAAGLLSLALYIRVGLPAHLMSPLVVLMNLERFKQSRIEEALELLRHPNVRTMMESCYEVDMDEVIKTARDYLRHLAQEEKRAEDEKFKPWG